MRKTLSTLILTGILLFAGAPAIGAVTTADPTCQDYTPGVEQTLPPCVPTTDPNTVPPEWATFYSGLALYLQHRIDFEHSGWMGSAQYIWKLVDENRALRSKVRHQHRRINHQRAVIRHLRAELAGS